MARQITNNSSGVQVLSSTIHDGIYRSPIQIGTGQTIIVSEIIYAGFPLPLPPGLSVVSVPDNIGDTEVEVGVTEQQGVAIANIAAGGPIGTAPATVDLYSVFLIDQTTAGQTLTLPTPTSPELLRSAYVANVGTASFICLAQTVAASSALEVLWTGSAWIYIE